MHLLSVCIPTYEMSGLGAAFLKHSFDILTQQTFRDFDVVISDHSTTAVIRDVCAQYETALRIRYFKNPHRIGNSPANTNNAISKATGRLIKILFQDDFLFGTRALETTVRSFDLQRHSWLVTASEHTKDDGATLCHPLFPRYHDRIHIGDNTISSPSVLTVKNDRPLRFDENLILRMDCDYYKRCHAAFGAPQIVNVITVVNRVGPHQLSATMNSDSLKEREYEYLLKKYGEPHALRLLLRYKARRRINRLKRTVKQWLLGDRHGSSSRPTTAPHPERR